MAKSEVLFTQVRLAEVLPTGTGRAMMTTWVNKSPRVGWKITLKGDPRVWEVIEVYATHPAYEINEQKWDNNI